MKHIFALLLISLFGFLTYKNSNKEIIKEFIILEKNKEDISFVYLDNNIHKNHIVEKEDFIKYEINDKYKVKTYSILFYIFIILLFLTLLIYLLYLTNGDISVFYLFF